MARSGPSATWIAAWVGAALFAAPAQAQLHFDVTFQENESDGRLSVHGRDFDQLPENRLVFGKRVFGRSVEIAGNPIPTERNPLGAKGAGEAGTVGALPAVMLAILNALSPLGVRHLDMPATGEAVWRAIQRARR